MGGNVDIFASTPLPLNFTINSFGSTITGTVVSASSGQIVIDWDCPEECPPSGYVTAELTHCGSEWFNPTVRIACAECTPSVEQCFLLDCNACIGIYVNGQPVILQHDGGNDPQLWCFDLGTVSCQTFDCDFDIPSNPRPRMGAIGKLRTEKPLESIPEVIVLELEELEQLDITPNLTKSNTYIQVSVPHSDTKTELQLVNMDGQVVIDKLIQGGKNELLLENLASGLYIVKIQNSTYSFTKKIIIQN